MENKKRKHGAKKHKQKRFTKHVRSLTLERISKVEGVEKLVLSPLTQQILDCRIGINITPFRPWIFIPKEKILENIELHENSSEFLPIRTEIETYPADEILVGCYGHEQNVPEKFLVCVTLDSTQLTLDALQVQEAARHQKILDSILRPCGVWVSYGSEEEVNESMPLSLRKPYQVHLSTASNTFYEKCKFSLRLVGDSPYGYAEVLTTRREYRNVHRRRIDTYQQCSNLKENAFTQTLMLPVMNIGVDGVFTMKKPKKMPPNAVEDFITRLDDAHILDLLQTNYFMDLCREDYNFQGARKMSIFKFPICILTFQDIFSCRGKRVSCVSWNAMRSGIIAASYVAQPRQTVVQEDFAMCAAPSTFEDHLVLIWSYTNLTAPCLYLHCDLEVTVLSFCSHDSNIIVGGCTNGQIVVWDITGRLDRPPSKILTREQADNHQILELLMTWMKRPPPYQHVYPVLFSKIDVSHLEPIQCIEWIPPDQIITKNGKVQKKSPNENTMQFLACGNGFIEIWDIGVARDGEPETKKKRLFRLSKVPEALTKYVSPLKQLKKNFIPVFRILVTNPLNRKPLSICKLLEKQSCISYKALNPETEKNVLKWTNFEHFTTGEDIWKQNFIFSTTFGEVASVSWDGFDYDQGCSINSYVGEVTPVKAYHDGPIIVCMESPIIQGMFLTIGGRVFAIWSTKNLQVPIFWRKAVHRYVAGSWLSIHPFQVGLVRYDTFKEIWDLMEDSKKAMKIIKGSGRATDGVYNDYQRTHAKKGTFVETNIAGEIKVYAVARDFIENKHKEVDEVIQYLEGIQSRRDEVNTWTNRVKEKKITSEEQVEEEVVSEESIELTDQVNIFKRKTTVVSIKPKSKWEMKEEAFMREVLFAKKKIKMDRIDQNYEILRQAKLLQKKYAVRFAQQLKEKDRNMKNVNIYMVPPKIFHKKTKVTIALPKTVSDLMKESFIEGYQEMEETTLHYIKTHTFHAYCTWADLHKRARSYTVKGIYSPEMILR